MCDRIAIIQNGNIVACGTMDQLRQQTQEGLSLEDLFLRLTGGEEAKELSAVLGE